MGWTRSDRRPALRAARSTAPLRAATALATTVLAATAVATAAIATTIALTGCSPDADFGNRMEGSGTVISEGRQVSGVSRVELSGGGILEVAQGADERLTVTTDDNLMPYLTTTVRGDTLEIKVFDRPGYDLRPTDTPRLRLTTSELTSIHTSGSFEVLSEEIDTGGLAIEGSGSCRIHIRDLEANSLEVDISGSGDIDIAGQVEAQRVDIRGSGTLRAPDLESAEARLSISGSGYALVWVTEYLDAEVSGSGRIEYWGSPFVTADRAELVPLGAR